MLEIKFVRQNMDLVQNSMIKRGKSANLEEFKIYDSKVRTILLEIEELRHRRNMFSEKIASMKKEGIDSKALVLEMRDESEKIKNLNSELLENEEKLNKILMEIPNIPDSSVPEGKDSSDNLLIRTVGKIPDFDFKPKNHWEIGEKLKIFDFERASKITGARFPLYFGAGAKLERSVLNFMLDIHTTEHGYTEILPPFIVNKQSLISTGQLPKFEDDLFKIEGWDYYLIPTAEVPVTNIHQNEILDESALPIFYTAYTPCFRSEAGSYGKDTKGLIRQHQFNKIELVKFSKPEDSYDELEKLTQNAETILKRLELPYQVVALCAGDLGFSSAKTYDIEVWMPAQGVYREISSCSNFENFQARRGNIRFKRKGGKKTEHVHTLNGSGLAVGRTVAAIIENYQQKDGSVIIPDKLKPYMGNIERISL
ncbi:MAG: serine--tRNA ligase [Proteobacteria bacterium]|nr:serine--tRNA ligase [Pseudomonadota bacterium]